MVGHDHVRVGGDPQVRDRHAATLQRFDLVGEDLRIDDDAVADRAERPVVKDPRGDEVKLELLVVADDRVAGVVSALKADDDVSPLGEQVCHLPFPLVAPLGANDHQSRHVGRDYEGCAGPAPGAISTRRSWPNSGSGLPSHISTSRETVRAPTWAVSSGSSRFVVKTIDRSSL